MLCIPVNIDTPIDIRLIEQTWNDAKAWVPKKDGEYTGLCTEKKNAALAISPSGQSLAKNVFWLSVKWEKRVTRWAAKKTKLVDTNDYKKRHLSNRTDLPNVPIKLAPYSSSSKSIVFNLLMYGIKLDS